MAIWLTDTKSDVSEVFEESTAKLADYLGVDTLGLHNTVFSVYSLESRIVDLVQSTGPEQSQVVDNFILHTENIGVVPTSLRKWQDAMEKVLREDAELWRRLAQY